MPVDIILPIKLLVANKTYNEILVELKKKGVKYSYSELAKYKKEGLPEEMITTKSYIFT